MNKQKTATIKLDFPVQLTDRTMNEVTMRRPTVGDLLRYPVRDNADLEGELTMLCHLCGIVPEDAQGMDAADYDALRNQYVFFRSGLPQKKPDAALPAADAQGLVQS